jgi:D-arabinose 1-dehydrogenase-like Zn-dependent alcohol dehydrogenase
MSTMRAVVYDRPEHFQVGHVAVSDPGRGEVLLKVLVAGICGTDLHLQGSRSTATRSRRSPTARWSSL